LRACHPGRGRERGSTESQPQKLTTLKSHEPSSNKNLLAALYPTAAPKLDTS
jgi:hypothetical protein